MSVQAGAELKKTGGAIVEKTKDIAKPATTEGVATNFVGYILSIPLSFAYDMAFDFVANKVIKKPVVSDILKVVLPAGIGAVFQMGKLPAGNIVAGVGYGIAVVSLIKIIISRIKGIKPVAKEKSGDLNVADAGSMRPWGLEGV